MADRILDFEDLKERFEAERLANERCRKERIKLISSKKKNIINKSRLLNKRQRS